MTFWTYMLRCSDGRYYVGHTDNLEQRMAQHQNGALPGFTQKRRPVDLVWSETSFDRDQAFAIEQQLKGWSRAKKEALIRGDWQAVRSLVSRAVRRDATSKSSVAPQDERIGNEMKPAHPEEGPGAGEGPSRSTPLPAIVLVRPQLAENIGKAARAMLNFGLTDLRLVSPRDGWPNPDAGPAASGADQVIAGARVYESVAAAVADCTHVYATTVRKRGVTKPVVTPEQAAGEVHAAATRSAFLFGPERSGLETDDVAIARTILTVPINPEFGSLNLAQAVILVAYEWSKHVASAAEGGVALAQPPLTAEDPPAPQDELEGMIVKLEELLDGTGHFFPPDRVQTDRRNLRSILTKPGWSSGEVRTLRGVLRSLERGLAGAARKS